MEENPIRFYLYREEDITGTSGTGRVANGVIFPNGTTVLHWNSNINTVTTFDSIEDVYTLHNHEGRTVICFIDRPPPSIALSYPSLPYRTGEEP